MTDLPGPDEYDGYEVPLEHKEAARAALDKLEPATRKIGLHLQTSDLFLVAEHGEEPRLGIAAQFLIGDMAWSEAVQDPEADAEADTLASMETHLMREKAQELRDRVRRKPDDDDENDDSA